MPYDDRRGHVVVTRPHLSILVFTTEAPMFVDLVFFDEVAELTHLSKRQLRRKWEAGTFPEPIRLSPRRLAWPANTLNAWLAEACAKGRIQCERQATCLTR